MDWEQHFRTRNPQFGMTAGGKYTIAELQDLVAAKDAELRNLDKLISEIKDKVDSNLQDLIKQLKDRYASAHAKAQIAISIASWNVLTPNSWIEADNEYRGILAAINPQWEQHTSPPGSLQGIEQTLAKLGAEGKNLETVPQPRKSSDVSIQELQASTAVTHTAAQIAEGAMSETGKLIGTGVSSVFHEMDWSSILKTAAIAGAALFILPRFLSPTIRRVI